jgi:hypothetical protein
MIFLADIHFIFLIIVFITWKNSFTNQQFINMVNNKRSLIFPFNSTLKNHLTNLSLSRKRRQSNEEFKSDSLKYFACALVNEIFEISSNTQQISFRFVNEIKAKAHLHSFHVY